MVDDNILLYSRPSSQFDDSVLNANRSRAPVQCGESKLTVPVLCQGVTRHDHILQISSQTLNFLSFHPTPHHNVLKMRKNEIYIEVVRIYNTLNSWKII